MDLAPLADERSRVWRLPLADSVGMGGGKWTLEHSLDFPFLNPWRTSMVDNSFSRTIDRVVASHALLLVTTYLDNKPISNGDAPESKTFKPLIDFICAIVFSSDTFATVGSAERPKIDRAQYLDHDSRYIGLVDRSEFMLWEVVDRSRPEKVGKGGLPII